MEPKLNILYEDNHLIVVFKRAGLLTQGDSSGDVSLMDEVKEFIKKRDKKPGNVFLGLVHRLDRPVSGLVIFGKTSKGASRISEEFRERTVKKIYHAWVEGLFSEANKKKVLRDVIRHNGKDYPAELSYEVIDEDQNKKISLVKITLGTGRHHQIRRQMSSINHPIVGDTQYGASDISEGNNLKQKGRILLSATELHFCTTVSRENVTVSIPLSSSFQ
jgi:23S rRNA pseudouridine1911/1915/1917 synthase